MKPPKTHSSNLAVQRIEIWRSIMVFGTTIFTNASHSLSIHLSLLNSVKHQTHRCQWGPQGKTFSALLTQSPSFSFYADLVSSHLILCPAVWWEFWCLWQGFESQLQLLQPFHKRWHNTGLQKAKTPQLKRGEIIKQDVFWRLLLLIQNRCEIHLPSSRMNRHKITLESCLSKIALNPSRHTHTSICIYVCAYISIILRRTQPTYCKVLCVCCSCTQAICPQQICSPLTLFCSSSQLTQPPSR